MSAPPSASVDVDAAVRFVQAIHGHERAGFAILMLKRGDRPPSHYGFDLGNPQWNVLRRVLINHTGGDCYIGVALYATQPQAGMQRKKEMVLHCHWLWCERDNHALPDTLPEPTFTIETSAGNSQDWWRMDAPLSLSDAEDYAERIAGVVGCAPMKDATRVLRIVGLKNHKPERHGEIARIADETGAVYSLGDFAHLPQISAPAAPVHQDGPRGKIGEGYRHHELLSLAGSLRRRGLSREMILAALREMNETQCAPPKPDAEIEKIADDASGWEPAPVQSVHQSQAAKGYADISPPEEAPAWTPPANTWPEPLAEEAYYGLAGAFVRLIAPQTEADPVAILAQFLTAFGNCIGRSPHFMAEADRHGMNLYAVLVGESSRGRKGTSWGHVRRLFDKVDEKWAAIRILDGLSSGEGLIQAVRDPERDADGNVKDDGPQDKRLLVQASEFANVLQVQGRDGSTLSGHLRNAWDGRSLRTLTRTPLVATAPHISLLGHVTRDELLRLFDDMSAVNGYGNRFQWFAVRRSKLLPLGGRISDAELAPIAARLSEAVSHAHAVSEIVRDEQATAIWEAVYADLSKDTPGVLGAMTARAEPQVMRLACIYALLDCSRIIRTEHLLAALGVWAYCERSARWIFGDRLGDPVADEILRALRATPRGMSRTEISGLFSNKREATRITHALEALEARGLARCEHTRPEGGIGRDVERWHVAKR